MVLRVPVEGAERLDRFGEHRDANKRGGGVREASSTEVTCKEWKKRLWVKVTGRKATKRMMRMQMMGKQMMRTGDEESESHSSSGSMQESPCSTCHYSDRCCHPCSWAEQSESGNGEDGSLGELSTSEDCGGKGVGKVGCPQAPPSSPLCEQGFSGKSLEVDGQVIPGDTTPTVGDLPPAGSQDAVVVHATEDELRTLE